MVIETTVDLYDEHEKIHYCSMVSKSFVRGYGGWNVRQILAFSSWLDSFLLTHTSFIGSQRSQGRFLSSSQAQP